MVSLTRSFSSSPHLLILFTSRLAFPRKTSHERGTFYPGGPEGDSSYVGEGAGKGFNINVPWNTRDVGDMECVAVCAWGGVCRCVEVCTL